MIAILAIGMVIFWYVFDEAARDGDGRSGFFGMSDADSGTRQRDSGLNWRRPAAAPWRVKKH